MKVSVQSPMNPWLSQNQEKLGRVGLRARQNLGLWILDFGLFRTGG
jgi:hypothetical protein